ncbi:MAG: DUF3800 domain-containing protein [Saprospiraceae bacterium]|nr:DUF3800 domain-containing protein [Lewinella sp.]
MAYLLFIDESGHDLNDSPYEVIAGVAVEDRDLWNLIREVQNLEIKHFGKRYSQGKRELKAKAILKRKTFRLAQQLPDILLEERRSLACKCLECGSNANQKELTALAQSKLYFVSDVLEAISNFRCKIFASISSGKIVEVSPDDLLRKDYVYLFERYFYFLEDRHESLGIMVFDELEKAKSHILIGQIENYFKKTFKGRQRSNLIIPEPFFVHSDLTTGVQLADLIAYLLCWGFRLNGMVKEARKELDPFLELVKGLRFRTIKEIGDFKEMEVWSIVYVK